MLKTLVQVLNNVFIAIKHVLIPVTFIIMCVGLAYSVYFAWIQPNFLRFLESVILTVVATRLNNIIE